MLEPWAFELVSSTYNISLADLRNKNVFSLDWSPTKFGFTPFQRFLSSKRLFIRISINRLDKCAHSKTVTNEMPDAV